MMERPLTANIRDDGEAADLASYRRSGGYDALRYTLGKTAPADVIATVTASGLSGFGGGGFPTGRKWQLMPGRASRPGPRYFVVNADEMEPGTFKDRLLLEGDPHQLLEGIILGAYAVEADTAYIFIRGEYTRAIARLEAAIGEATAAGLLGANILGSGFGLDIHVHGGAGRYICGEETALLNSLEGKRAIPRPIRRRADCGADPPSSTMSRRSAMSPTSSATVPRGIAGSVATACRGRRSMA